MAGSLAALVAALDLASEEPDRFVGRSPPGRRLRIFGGLVIAQALVAAARTAGGRPVHAAHASFLLPGDPEEPIGYAVERLRDGASFTSRRCLASQHGRPVFALSASFHAAEPDAFDHADPMPPVPGPDDLPPPVDLPPAARAFLAGQAAVELRPAHLGRPGAAEPRPGRRAVWMRAAGALPDDPVLHAAVLAYMSDITLLDTALVPHGRSVFDPGIQAASLDHAVWFHRPARADGWLLYAEDSPNASGARGFARGAVFDRAGTLVASTAQEGLVRRRR